MERHVDGRVRSELSDERVVPVQNGAHLPGFEEPCQVWRSGRGAFRAGKITTHAR